MFSLLGLRRVAKVAIADSEATFRTHFERYAHQFDISTSELEQAHEQCDGRLVEKIHSVIEPMAGPEGFKTEAWHHNLDFYGDGVRSLEVDATRFTPALIEPLHALLRDEHEQFCIYIKFYRNFGDDPPEFLGTVAIFQPCIIVTDSLLPVFEHV